MWLESVSWQSLSEVLAASECVGAVMLLPFAHLWCNAVVATIGKATRNDNILDEMFKAGMTAARFDLSFGDISYHSQSLELVHNAATKANRLCSMILDLGDKECQVIQPSCVDENGWHQCTQRITISNGQRVTLTANGELHVPEVRTVAQLGQPLPASRK